MLKMKLWLLLPNHDRVEYPCTSELNSDWPQTKRRKLNIYAAEYDRDNDINKLHIFLYDNVDDILKQWNKYADEKTEAVHVALLYDEDQ